MTMRLSARSTLLALYLVLTVIVPVMAAGMNSVTIKTSSGDHQWQVELASDGASRSRGLMHRQSMAPDHGMLFRFDQTSVVSMWMKNTLIPLDMVFVDAGGVVRHVHRDAIPGSLEIISSRVPVRFVLEINAGEADKYGLAPGDVLKHPWILPVN